MAPEMRLEKADEVIFSPEVKFSRELWAKEAKVLSLDDSVIKILEKAKGCAETGETLGRELDTLVTEAKMKGVNELPAINEKYVQAESWHKSTGGSSDFILNQNPELEARINAAVAEAMRKIESPFQAKFPGKLTGLPMSARQYLAELAESAPEFMKLRSVQSQMANILQEAVTYRVIVPGKI